MRPAAPIRVAPLSNNSKVAYMADHIYRVTEIAAHSEVSNADAIDKAMERASKTLRHLGWVEVKKQQGEIEGGKIKQYQVALKVGFRVDD
jgi:dodecin